ncbi:hypothetical protein ACHAQA_006428 [Verticillium albo-atrum]
MDERDFDSNRRRSFGRGGAGNIRSHADAKLPEPHQHDHGDGRWRRRSSVLSSKSNDSTERRRMSLLHGWSGLFHAKSDLKEEACILEEPKREEAAEEPVSPTRTS